MSINIALVSPCYNEEIIIDSSVELLLGALRNLIDKQKVSDKSFILFVNDGSTDNTWRKIKDKSAENPEMVRGISLGRNVGHQEAILAGMMEVKDSCDAVITIDADIQDDLGAIEKMVDAYNEGFDVVYGVKTERSADTIIKRLTATAFYKMQKKMGIDIVYNHADFRLMSKRALEQMFRYEESNLYLRGIIPQLGFPSTTVKDEISPRKAGKSKYSLSKMLGLALDGITSFSIKPIYWVMYLGLGYMFVSLIIGLYVAYSLIFGTVERGWSSLILSIWIVGGSILIALGIVGLYVGKTFIETKHRPKYNIIDDTAEF